MAVGTIIKLGQKGIKLLKDNKIPIIGVGGAAGVGTLTKKNPKAETTTIKPTKRPTASGKTSAKTSGLKNKGRTTKVTPVKNPVRSKKDGTIVRDKNKKAVTFGGNKLPKKVGSLFRSNKMGGGMMKKRMKRGGRAK